MNEKSETSSEIKKAHHVVSAISYVVVTEVEINQPKMQLFIGENSMQDFIKSIKNLADDYIINSQKFREPTMSKEDWLIHNNSTKCWM